MGKDTDEKLEALEALNIRAQAIDRTSKYQEMFAILNGRYEQGRSSIDIALGR
jgi:hypothetical protein